MLFDSLAFAIFFPITLLVYYLLPLKCRHFGLLFASYVFYMYWNPMYALLLIVCTLITYIGGLGIAIQTSPRRKKIWLVCTIVFCFCILVFFKYTPFITASLNNLLTALGSKKTIPVFDIVLPLGISFYTFQAVGYVIDVYRGKIETEKDFFRYALFVSFFPQLLAGPISRASTLLTQINTPKNFNLSHVKKGFLLMLWGFFLKLVIANRAATLVNAVYNDPLNFIGLTFFVATLFFSIQIYCDFAGYSAIAMGAAQVLGFDLLDNFRQPYFSVSISDFWHRWHISLSTWFRDYLYIPLGGNRHGLFRKYLNIMITFLVSGLWHGSSWSYILWGALNGFMQIIGDLKNHILSWLSNRKLIKNFTFPKQKPFSARLASILITFSLINVSWVFFRAQSIAAAFTILQRSVAAFNPWIFIDGSLYRLGIERTEFWFLVAFVGFLFYVDLKHERGFPFRDAILRQQLWFRWLCYLGLLFSILLFGVYGPNMEAASFIYVQF